MTADRHRNPGAGLELPGGTHRYVPPVPVYLAHLPTVAGLVVRYVIPRGNPQ